MQNAFLKLYVKAQSLREAVKNEEGQDLIEYALLGCVVAAAIVAIAGPLQTSISTAFSKLTASINAA